MKKTTLIKAILAVAGIANCAGADVIWPADGEWTALQQGTDLYYDAIGDKNPGSIDLVGTIDTFPAGSWALIEVGYVDGGVIDDAFMFRLRLDGNGKKRKFNWQVSLDTDGDASNEEWMLQLVQSGKRKGQGVELIQTADGGPTLGDVDTGDNTIAWLGDKKLYSRWTAIADSRDYYVDIAIPWTTFTSITGVTELEQIRTVLSTSSTHTGIKGDAPLGASLSAQISDVLSDNIPEPAVASLLLSSGIGFLAFRRIFNRHPTDHESPE
jgi:hypothetical protein